VIVLPLILDTHMCAYDTYIYRVSLGLHVRLLIKKKLVFKHFLSIHTLNIGKLTHLNTKTEHIYQVNFVPVHCRRQT